MGSEMTPDCRHGRHVKYRCELCDKAKAEELAALRAEIARLCEALEWYANPTIYVCDEAVEDFCRANRDSGARARRAIATEPKETSK
jgi:hypothetical protein